MLTFRILRLAVLAATVGGGLPALAQGGIYKCPGNEYTDRVKPDEARARGCQLIEGTAVTIIPAARPATGNGSASASRPAASPSSGPRVDTNEQRARDADARAILEAELRKAESRRAEIAREYNNGEPEKQGAEFRNHQKYIERVAELKAGIARLDSDITGLKRELSRLPGGAPPAASASAPAAAASL